MFKKTINSIRFDFPLGRLATAQLLRQGLLIISNAQIRVFRAASTKILVVGEKMHFAYVQWMRNHASMRRNRVSNLYLVDAPVLDQVVEKVAISFDFSANISNSGCSN